MDAHKGGQSPIGMTLLRCLLLLTVSTAFCLAQQQPEIPEEMPPVCVILREEGINIDIYCGNIIDFSAVTEAQTSTDKTVATLRIYKSPQLVIQRADLDNPAFKDLEKLYWIRSEKTNFDPEPLRGLLNLEKLILRENNLSSIAADSFAGLTNLKELNLRECKVASIEAGTFNVLRNLELLDLSDNLLTSIPSGLFEGTTVRTLFLNGNQLTSIEEGSLTGLDNLIKIDLYHNKIKTIDSKAFQTLVHLHTVDLEGNQLEGIDSRLFENNPLVGLSLRRNIFENIANVQLNHTSLKALSLGFCNIQTLPVDFFNNLPSLSMLDINGNNITTIPPGIFTPLTNLRALEMNNNNLTSLSVASFSQLHTLAMAVANNETFKLLGEEFDSELNMKYNPWDCSSTDMTELRAWCEQNQVVFDDLFDCDSRPPQ